MIRAEIFNVEESDLVDFHSHVLPGVDHGSDSVNCTLKQFDLAKKHSVNRIMATPHFYPNVHTISRFLDARNNAVELLKKELPSNFPNFKVGAEVLICEGLERFPDLDKLCFMNTRYIMLELPFLDFSEEYAITAGAISDMGYKVILAHADRYPKEIVDIMIDYGVDFLQLNPYALTSPFKKKHIYRWLDNGLVCALGSDIHGASSKAYRKFALAKRRMLEYLPSIKKSSDEIWAEVESVMK